MGWMQRLCQTYDNMEGTDAFSDSEHPLAPIGFTVINPILHVILTEEGSFAYATRFEKDVRVQVIPSDPDAEARTGISPHPLCEQLKYVAGDLTTGASAYFNAYITKLSDWCEQPAAPSQLKLLCNYLMRKSLIHDMQKSGFMVDIRKDAEKFVCFSIQSYECQEQALWRREDIRESWLNRLSGRMGGRALCYVEGALLPTLRKHPPLSGKAKLISAKDGKTAFQYKGRFEDASQALAVSFDASIKAHNALIWLLKRQGFERYGLKVVAWATNGCPIPSPAEDDGLDMLAGLDRCPDTFEAYGSALRDAAVGFARQLDAWKPEAVNRVVILGLEAATTGRMSINYYQEMPGGEYVQRLMRWYDGCKWEVRRLEGPVESRRMVQRVWTPTPLEIATAVLGKQASDIAQKDRLSEKSATKLMRQLRLRLLKCTVEATPLPRDIVLNAIRRASAPRGFTDGNGRWLENEWRISLSVACALIRMEQVDNGEEGTGLKLNEDNHDRSYLYGRLLAIADKAEYDAMDKDKDRSAARQTNAIRYMQIFQQRPFDTWMKLHTLMLPYLSKLPDKGGYYQWLIGQVEVLFGEEERESRRPLDGKYLQGYYCQRQALFTKKEVVKGANPHDNSQG